MRRTVDALALAALLGAGILSTGCRAIVEIAQPPETEGAGGRGGAGGAVTSSGSAGSGMGGADSNTSATSASGNSSGGMMGACVNPVDEMKLTDQQAARIAANGCAIMCAAYPVIPPCAKDCMVMMLGISDTCAQCWGDFVLCGMTMCVQPCVADPNTPKCLMCTGVTCDPAYHLCAGI